MCQKLQLILASASSTAVSPPTTHILVTITPASLYLWYRPVYSGYKKSNSLYFSIFMLFFGFHVAWCFYMVLGFVGSGSAGIINCITAFAAGKVVAGVFCVVSTAGWASSAGAGVWIGKSVYSHFKDAGLSLNDAKRDIAGIGVRETFSAGIDASVAA